jgi:hypothetical protein
MNTLRPVWSTRRPALGLAASMAVVLTLAACGGSASGSSSAGGNSPTQPAGSAPAGSGRAGGLGPAASGTIAAVSGKTMQVQSQQNGQVAVTWKASTKFTRQLSVAAHSIKSGDCVSAFAGSGSSATATSFTASTVSVSKPVNGSCSAGFGGAGRSGAPFAGGGRPSGFPSGARPSGAPSGFPGGGRGGAGIGAIANGAVLSVSGSKLVVAARSFGPGSSGSTTKKTVTLASSTKITTERSATSKAVKVGRCATAVGKADSSGAVAAIRVAISNPVGGQCSRFGRGFGGGSGG